MAYTWKVVAGALPPGLSLSASGTITGTPSLAGVYSFTVQATDHLGATGTRALSITIATVSAPTPAGFTSVPGAAVPGVLTPGSAGLAPAQGPPLAVATQAVAPASIGVPYQGALGATGGTPPYTWSVIT